MNLYKSVYWSKRVVVALAVVLFVCSGVRIFQFVSRKFTETRIVGNIEPKAEIGFGKLSPLSITPLNTEGFSPKTFRNLTVRGDLNIDNGYPLESTKTPIANVYKIIEKPISLETAQGPRNVARNLNFIGEPVSSSSTVQVWKEGSKKLEVNGQYMTINYENNDLRNNPPAGNALSSTINIQNQGEIKRLFSNTFLALGVQNDLASYVFNANYVDFDSKKGIFVATQPNEEGKFIRLNAVRTYSSLSKSTQKAVETLAAYPNYTYSNNSIIIPVNLPKDYKSSDILVKFTFYDWPISQETATTNKQLQTYNIKTPKKAYDELTKQNRYLVSATEWNTKIDIDPALLKGIDIVSLKRVRLEMYEDTINTSYIQPVYVFICEAEKEGKKYQLTYYVPAVTDLIQ